MILLIAFFIFIEICWLRIIAESLCWNLFNIGVFWAISWTNLLLLEKLFSYKFNFLSETVIQQNLIRTYIDKKAFLLICQVIYHFHLTHRSRRQLTRQSVHGYKMLQRNMAMITLPLQLTSLHLFTLQYLITLSVRVCF